ncbi:MAG: hypothetical protein Q9167_007760 [Letrouitia subvulpina]
MIRAGITEPIQVWYGTGLGCLICLIIGGAFLGTFYGLQKDHFSKIEAVWEGVFSLVASVIITLMGAALLRVSKMQEKWRLKIAQALEAKDSIRKGSSLWSRFKIGAEKYAMFYLPFTTVLREGLEAISFIGGVALSVDGRSVPLAAIVGIATGIVVGYLIYNGTKSSAETQRRPGLVQARTISAKRANPYINGGGGWGIFNAILGWQNSATLGSVISYNLYWLTVIVAFLAMGYNEKKDNWPVMKNMQSTARGNKFLASIRPKAGSTTRSSSNDDSLGEKAIESSKTDGSQEKVTTEVRRFITIIHRTVAHQPSLLAAPENGLAISMRSYDAGDLVLHFKDEEKAINTFFRVSAERLRDRSYYFNVLLDPDKFSEGIMVRKQLTVLHQNSPDIALVPSSELPRLTIHDVGCMPGSDLVVPALRLLLEIMHSEPLSWDSDYTKCHTVNFMATVAIISDRFAATSTIGPLIRQSRWAKATWPRQGPDPPFARELMRRQRLLIGYRFNMNYWFSKSSAELVIGGSERWSENNEDQNSQTALVHDQRPLVFNNSNHYHDPEASSDIEYWSMPDGLEVEELYCRREYVLKTIASLQSHFIGLYSSKLPQCRMGYESSPQCDSFQLGEMVRFFTRKKTVNLQSTFIDSNDSQQTYKGNISDLVTELRECSSYQVDKHHTHCGLRARLLPQLDRVQNLMQAGICRHCWDIGRDNWSDHPTGGKWFPAAKMMFTADERDWTHL